MLVLLTSRCCTKIQCTYYNSIQKEVKTQKEAKTELLNTIKTANRGLQNSQTQKSQILKNIQELISSKKDSNIPATKKINGRWKLIWTTEKETLFIFQNAGFFGTKAGDTYQIIDIEKQKLQNLINFPPEGFFLVDSNIQIVDDKRTSFQFQAAKLKVGERNIPFPPFGQGWFDTLYIDDDLRISKDSRNDYLVTVLDGPPELL